MPFRPEEKMMERYNALFLNQQQNIYQWGRTVGSWLVVGNAGALVYTLNLYSQPDLRIDPELLRPSAILFASGLVLAFLGASLAYLVSMLSMIDLTKIVSTNDEIMVTLADIKQLEIAGNIITEDNALRKKLDDSVEKAASHRSLVNRAWWLFAMVVIVFLISGALFAFGALTPLMNS